VAGTPETALGHGSPPDAGQQALHVVLKDRGARGIVESLAGHGAPQFVRGSQTRSLLTGRVVLPPAKRTDLRPSRSTSCVP